MVSVVSDRLVDGERRVEGRGGAEMREREEAGL